jgi:signal transduction histidine kinase
VAHDFNNLLTVINGYSELLLTQLPPENPLNAMAKEILQADERARSLTGRLLAFSRQQILRPQLLNLNNPIRSMSSMLERLLGETIVLNTDLAPNLWTITSDKGQIDQVMMNLAVNARDEMPNGVDLTIATRNMTVTVTQPCRHRVVPPGEYVHMGVRDNGQGMSQDTLGHLFKPFYTTKPEGKGACLGLATVHGIVTQNRGSIVVDSALGQGYHLPSVFLAFRGAVGAPPGLPARSP